MFEESSANSFRRWGYLQAELDYLGRLEKFAHPELDDAPKKEADKWRAVYCGPIGVEFMHFAYPDRAAWVANRMEAASEADVSSLPPAFILRRIAQTECFEKFLHSKYVGVTRFSVEGSASLIPLLDSVLTRAADLGFEVAILGMSHRARLAVMTEVVGTPKANIIACFEDVDPEHLIGRGDVKYHKGATGIYRTHNGKELRVHLASNPSHLESIDPVVMGRVKARQQRLHDDGHTKVLAVLLHGDAAFAGQGIAAESLNFCGLNGFSIGGTIHIVVNNLIGFTEDPKSLHSSRFATDIAKRLPIPIFHVNGEEPDAVVRVGQMAMDYRAKWKTDVVIDHIGFRRHGHNEGDDPTITQPVLYEKISDRPPLYKTYAKQIGFKDSELTALEEEVAEQLARDLETGRAMTKQPSFYALPEYWNGYHGGWYSKEVEVETAIDLERLKLLGQRLADFPSGFSVHPKLKKLLDQRVEMAAGSRPVDWGMGEALALASLLTEGVPVRLTGQDCRRGTFSHRHAAFFDYQNGAEYAPLANLEQGQAWFNVFGSMLSEAAAVGFEYGFSRDFPEALVLWEAQFGDFINGAQIIIDQFVAAGEDKWGLLSGLVLLLPHGYEGRGPEHSSARIERFLQLAAEDNMQICYPSTAAQYFHLLRRQALRHWRKPLIVFTPKSMLRSPAASSPIEEFASGGFQTVMTDSMLGRADKLIFCTGKLAHELGAEQEKSGSTGASIVRVEQLYPFPEDEIVSVLSQNSSAKLVWAQEEPENMGALSYIRPLLQRVAEGRTVTTVKRFESASPATGSGKAHAMEQQAVLRLALTTN